MAIVVDRVVNAVVVAVTRVGVVVIVVETKKSYSFFKLPFLVGYLVQREHFHLKLKCPINHLINTVDFNFFWVQQISHAQFLL